MKRSQGEIFGIALLFVIILVGILLYTQIKALDPNRDGDLQQDGEYKLLAESTLNTILETSTGCYVERGRDSVQDLINFCMEYSYSGSDPTYRCEFSSTPIRACEHSIKVLNDTLYSLFNTSTIGAIPFELQIYVPANNQSIMHGTQLSNFGEVKTGSSVVDKENYRGLGFKRAPSGLRTWATAQRNIDMELYLYYR